MQYVITCYRYIFSDYRYTPNMLDFLVTSKVRRRLLSLLWGDGMEGSVPELAARAHVGLASVYREVLAMQRHDLVTLVHRHGRDAFAANKAHPAASALAELVAKPERPRLSTKHASDQLYGQLRSLGAPLPNTPVAVARDEVESVLVRGVRASHRDPRLARTLPLCFWRQRNTVDVDRLLATAKELREKHAVGFFLDLTATLSREPRLATWAPLFRDSRVRDRDFFLTPESPSQRRLAELNTPSLARDWGLRMNLSLDAFQSLFQKFETPRG